MRASGILLHITSLPSSYGVGTLADVDKFIEFLKEAKQSYWQILPVTPTDFVNSPYASPSAFAGNTLLIDCDQLAKEGLICENTLFAGKKARGNDYAYAQSNKQIALQEAFANFVKNDPPQDYFDFAENNSYWLEDYALFCALKQHFGGKPWYEWDSAIKLRERATLEIYRDKLADEVDFHIFCQYVFDKQWKIFRNKLRDANIQLIGDIPIYVSYDSADVWAHGNLFDLDDKRRPRCVAGVPPDYFSQDGQLWGNPLYNWKAMASNGYDWWLRRVSRCAELFDVLRIDHFRAFDSYYCIKYGLPNARVGRWKRGVGYNFLHTIKQANPSLTIVAEDLGDIPQSVLRLRDKCGFAGMKVMQFAFDGNPDNPFLPSNYNNNCVAYLGTHDNDTTIGWYNSLDDWHKSIVRNTLQLSNDNGINWQLIGSLAQSNADLVIFTMQDIAGDDSSSRMNTPGTLGWWKYMAKRSDFCSANAKSLAQVTQNTNRCFKEKNE